MPKIWRQRIAIATLAPSSDGQVERRAVERQSAQAAVEDDREEQRDRELHRQRDEHVA